MAGPTTPARPIWPYVAAGVLLALSASALLAWALPKLAFWWMGSCARPSLECRGAEWLLNYWWAGFFAVALLFAWALHRAWSRPRRPADPG